MKKKNIITLIIISVVMSAFVYFYFQGLDFIDSNSQYLYSGATQLTNSSGQIVAQNYPLPEVQNTTQSSGGTQATNINPPQNYVLPSDVILAVSDSGEKEGGNEQIEEEIFNPEPPQFEEQRYNLLIPPQSQRPQNQQFLSDMGGGPNEKTEEAEEDEEEETEEVLEDDANATSTPAVPEISLWLSNYGITSRQFGVNWHSSSTNISYYDVQYKIGSTSASVWQDFAMATTSESGIFEVPLDLEIYYFKARSVDASSTPSVWQEIEAPINFYPVIINEIAWMGTVASTSEDEWIELFNKTDYVIDLVSSTLKSITDESPNIILKGVIEPRGYFLLERTDNSTVSDIAADQIYSGALKNGGEILELRDGFGNLLDSVPLSPLGNWLAGATIPVYKSMERVNPYLGADVPNNWQSNSTSTRNGLNADGQPINGTPKAQNSVFDLDFFYLYPAKNTTATSTFLEWTESFIPNFKKYKVIRSFNNEFIIASTTTVAATTTANFFDGFLESEMTYYYEISACDLSDYCAFSNIVSTTTSEFPFFWTEPQLIFETATSSGTSSEPLILDVIFDAFAQPQIIWISSSTAPNATTSDVKLSVFDNQNQPYIFWIKTSPGQSSIYFKYQKADGWTSDKQIFVLPYEIDKFAVVIDFSNTARLVFIVDGSDLLFIPSQVYLMNGIVE